MLNCVTPQHDQVLRESAERFPEKNRSTNYLPCTFNECDEYASLVINMNLL